MARVRGIRRKHLAPRNGLLYWAVRAGAELVNASASLGTEPVHDLRVAVRRCRSMAEGLRTIDPAPGWKQFRALPKPLFSALGALRDTQVLQEWLERLNSAQDPVRQELAARLTARATEQKRAAGSAMAEFNSKRWLSLAEDLDRRARKLPPGSRVFQHLALERWEEAFHLHTVAMRTRRGADLHQLRIGIKRFRYTVENFLPVHHKSWGRELKHMQDLLGEVHDLDVFLDELRRRTGPGAILRARIRAERAKRIREYEICMLGPQSLWTVWREGLPSGRELSLAINAKLRQWARGIDPEPVHSRRVAQISARLWQGLVRACGLPNERRASALLRSAALLHNVGEGVRRSKRASFRAKVMSKLSAPIGWSAEEMRVVRLVSRYAGEGFPSATEEDFRLLSAPRRQQVLRLAGILRLAHALDVKDGPTPLLQVKKESGVLILSVEGFDPKSSQATEVAAARHLLEIAEAMPILVGGLASTALARRAGA